jgi:hypothetical protein
MRVVDHYFLTETEATATETLRTSEISSRILALGVKVYLILLVICQNIKQKK